MRVPTPSAWADEWDALSHCVHDFNEVAVALENTVHGYPSLSAIAICDGLAEITVPY